MNKVLCFFGSIVCMTIMCAFWMGGGILIVMYADWIEVIGVAVVVGAVVWVVVEPKVYYWRWKRRQRLLLRKKS